MNNKSGILIRIDISTQDLIIFEDTIIEPPTQELGHLRMLNHGNLEGITLKLRIKVCLYSTTLRKHKIRFLHNLSHGLFKLNYSKKLK